MSILMGPEVFPEGLVLRSGAVSPEAWSFCMSDCIGGGGTVLIVPNHRTPPSALTYCI